MVAVGSGGVNGAAEWDDVVKQCCRWGGGHCVRWGLTATALWLAGDNGTLLFWNGSTASSFPTAELSRCAESGNSGQQRLGGGDNGRILHFDGSAWSVHAQGSALTRQNLNAVYGVGASEVYAAGSKECS